MARQYPTGVRRINPYFHILHIGINYVYATVRTDLLRYGFIAWDIGLYHWNILRKLSSMIFIHEILLLSHKISCAREFIGQILRRKPVVTFAVPVADMMKRVLHSGTVSDRKDKIQITWDLIYIWGDYWNAIYHTTRCYLFSVLYQGNSHGISIVCVREKRGQVGKIFLLHLTFCTSYLTVPFATWTELMRVFPTFYIKTSMMSSCRSKYFVNEAKHQSCSAWYDDDVSDVLRADNLIKILVLSKAAIIIITGFVYTSTSKAISPIFIVPINLRVLMDLYNVQIWGDGELHYIQSQVIASYSWGSEADSVGLEIPPYVSSPI